MKYRYNSAEENCFKTISDFKECIIRGGEPVFSWKGLQYGVCFYGEKLHRTYKWSAREDL